MFSKDKKPSGHPGNVKKTLGRNLAKVEVVSSNLIARSILYPGLGQYWAEPFFIFRKASRR